MVKLALKMVMVMMMMLLMIIAVKFHHELYNCQKHTQRSESHQRAPLRKCVSDIVQIMFGANAPPILKQ